jgi:hypothetical protein
MFFKRKAKITDIQYQPEGWLQDTFDPYERRWQAPKDRAIFRINCWPEKTKLPSKILEDERVLRGYFRSKAIEAHGGLILGKSIKLQGIPTIKAIFKAPQPLGMRYVGVYLIPFKFCSFGLKIIVEESENFGWREMMLAAEFFDGKMMPSSIEGKIEAGWLIDPYDKNCSLGQPMSLAEQAEYDVRFPEDPLTKLRIWMQDLEENLNFHPRLYKLRKF